MSIKQFTQAHETFERAVQAKKSALKSEKKRYYTILADDDQNNAAKILGELDNARSPRISVEESSTGEKKAEGEFADILVHEVIEQFNAILLETVPFKRFYIKPQLAALWKQKIALENLMYFPSDNVRQIISLLEKPDLVRWETFLPKMIGDSSWKFLTNTAYQSNEAQRDFVAKALRTPDFAFLEGPPGAGK
nr:hypothetical protein [Candidatus Sigynarchaeota archaeon]